MKSKQSTHDTINLGHTGLFHSTACFEAAGQLVLLKITAFISSFIPKPAEYTSYLFKNSTFCPHNVLCILYGSQNKQRLFSFTTSTGWFL